jgi:hypothetical protein
VGVERARGSVKDAHPGNFTVKEVMKYVLVRQDRVSGEMVEESLEHAFLLCDHGMGEQ